MIFPDFNSICFDKPVEIFALKGQIENLNLNTNIRSSKVPYICVYANCPDSIILFFRELSSDFQTVILPSDDDHLIILCYNFEDCLDLFMQRYKQTGNEEFDRLAKKVIELAILDKEIRYLVLRIQ
jgi:hypothetical protein